MAVLMQICVGEFPEAGFGQCFSRSRVCPRLWIADVSLGQTDLRVLPARISKILLAIG